MAQNRFHSRRFYRPGIPILFILTIIFVNIAFSQNSLSIDELKRGFQTRYNKEVVSVRGWVATEKRVESRTFKGYYLKDRFGSLILIRTTNPLPEITSEILVFGIALQDADTSDIFITETKREIVPSADKVALEQQKAAAEQREKEQKAAEDAAQQKREEEAHSRTIMLYSIGGAILLLVVMGIALTFRRRAAIAEVPMASTTQPSPAEAAAAVASTAPPLASPSVDNFKTVRVYKTTKVLPGRLVVIENHQESDIIHLSDQTGRGEIEIGRDSPDVTDGIRIKDKTNTLSRRQGRIVYSASTREFKLVNLAGDSSNPTTVNGRQMTENENVVLKDGDTLGMGNLELKFRQK